MWHLGTLFTGGFCSAGLIVGLNGLKDIFQRKQFCDSVSWSMQSQNMKGSNAYKGEHQLQRREHSKIFDCKYTIFSCVHRDYNDFIKQN